AEDGIRDATVSGVQTCALPIFMSAALAWDVAPAPVRIPARPARPRLVSVPCGEEVSTPPSAPLRLTRAGRLAITLAVVVVAVVGSEERRVGKGCGCWGWRGLWG